MCDYYTLYYFKIAATYFKRNLNLSLYKCTKLIKLITIKFESGVLRVSVSIPLSKIKTNKKFTLPLFVEKCEIF